MCVVVVRGDVVVVGVVCVLGVVVMGVCGWLASAVACSRRGALPLPRVVTRTPDYRCSRNGLRRPLRGAPRLRDGGKGVPVPTSRPQKGSTGV